jgi:hypothetical protein
MADQELVAPKGAIACLRLEIGTCRAGDLTSLGANHDLHQHLTCPHPRGQVNLQ